MPDSAIVIYLTKLLPVFVYPLGLGITLILVGSAIAGLGRRRIGAAIIVGASAGLWLASTPVVAEWALGTLERRNPPRAISELPNADVAIVLGGALGQPVPPRKALDLSPSSDRILHAARIYRAGKVQRILVTGGNLPWLPQVASEAELIRDLLMEWGVPESAITIAGASRNTYENALEVRAMHERAPFQSALLITSAAHMPRSLAIFKRADLPVMPATTDVEVVDPGPWMPLRSLPDAEALAMTTAAMKEWIGYWAYWARGYL